MIVISQRLKDYITGFESMEQPAKILKISVSSLYAYLNEERSCGEDFIESVIENIGWEWESAFEVKKDR